MDGMGFEGLGRFDPPSSCLQPTSLICLGGQKLEQFESENAYSAIYYFMCCCAL